MVHVPWNAEGEECLYEWPQCSTRLQLLIDFRLGEFNFTSPAIEQSLARSSAQKPWQHLSTQQTKQRAHSALQGA